MYDLACWVHEHAVVLETESVATQDVSVMHGSRVRARVADQTDAIFFQRRVTPLKI